MNILQNDNNIKNKNNIILSLFGYLLIQRASLLFIKNINYEDKIFLIKKGKYKKPYLFVENVNKKWDFNLSHSDDYIIFTSDFNTQIGVDIMKIKLIPENDINDNNVEKFIDIFHEQLSQNEINFINNNTNCYAMLVG